MDDLPTYVAYLPAWNVISDLIEIGSLNVLHICLFRYSCTEYDPFWGWLAFAFIFLPGVVFSYMTAQKLRKSPYFWIFLCFTPLTTMIFPFLLILVKILVLFHNGPELNRLNDCLTFAEGQIESVCQLGLQLYIIFKKVDR